MIRFLPRIFGARALRGCAFTSALLIPLMFALSALADDANKLLSVEASQAGGLTTITIATENPVGYRYTVYDSFDPVRVVIDFPGMETAEANVPAEIALSPVSGARVSSFDLESGKLGRVEILLDNASKYDVSAAETRFTVSFPAEIQAEMKSTQKEAVAIAATKPQEPETVVPPVTPQTPERPVSQEKTAGRLLHAPQIESGKALFLSNAPLEKIKYFKLGGPPRLVVDFYDVVPSFPQRSFLAAEGMGKVRIGVYPDKTRAVFDASGEKLPEYLVTKDGSEVTVTWGMPTAPGNATQALREETHGVPVTVKQLDFASEEGNSVFTVGLSSSSVEILQPEQNGDLVRFGVKNALIGQELRRTFDASAFPSVVRLITPYTVQNGNQQEVRFAVELKGPAEYSLEKDADQLHFRVDDGPFALKPKAGRAEKGVAVVASPGGTTQLKGSIPEKEDLGQPVMETGQLPMDNSSVSTVASGGSVRIAEEKAGYSGEKISLVFDNADIRKILQLIGEVSQLNIIASDEVKGNVTLRLQDVPWDQALDLIMDINDLGMIKEGNVARIMPRSKIREMEEDKLTARRTKEKLEDLITEVIAVSHTDLVNVTKPAEELLTERGKITPDSRNKQIIVTDIPSVIGDIKQLVKILDTPEKQVLIEARIVEANSNFSRDLGVKWGFQDTSANANFPDLSNAQLGLGGSFIIPPSTITNLTSSGFGSSFTFGSLADGTVLDLRLSALETSGNGRVISTPRVATLNGEAAMISQGTKIPYQSVSDQGTETKFESAELKLEVTPVINPDSSIILEIVAANSSVGATVPTGVSTAISIDEKKAETKVLVRDGETTVIGGIFVEDERESESGVPLLMHVPIIGHLFKSTTQTNERRELLIFITPRILQ